MVSNVDGGAGLMGKVLIPHGVVAEEAVYKEQIIEEYRGNPFIEALPPIFSPEEVIDKMIVYPPYNEGERELDAHYRIHLVQKLFQCFQPLPLHLDLESRISRVIRQGYLARNPISRDYVISLNDGYKAIQNCDINTNQQFRSTACGFTTIGVSGMGKSVSVNRVLSMYPQVIVHSRYKGQGFSFYQIVWLKLDCPFDGSVKGLCIDFFNKIDQLMGTDYYKKVGSYNRSVDYMLTLIAQVVRSTGLGLLVIDEIQHLCEARGFGDEKMLNFFVTLVNTAGVPVVLIGNPKAMSILQSEFRQARRGSGQGDMIWDRLEPNDDYELLLDALWQYQWTRKVSPLTPNIKNILYEESQGVIDIVVKLMIMSQSVAITTGIEKVTESLISQVAKEHFKLVRPMLLALKSGNMKEIAKYSDISTLEIDYSKVLDQGKRSAKMQAKIRALKKKKEERDKEERGTKAEKAIMKLLELGIKPKEAQKAVEAVLETEGQEIDDGQLIIKAVQSLSSMPSKRKTKEIPKSKDDVRYIVEEGKKEGKTAYEALKEKGYIQKGEDWIFRVG